ncbi:MAG: glucosamine-6-phosphate isomerase [Planctomycetota bacterium]|nr:glucosamine-6-phosphate isomerase [Planctomycetota bacterium]MEE2739056.1 glucosamine-6-phosphate isomerase [Planctomycetota bacterium]
MDLLTTIVGSKLETFFPSGWDWEKIDRCASQDPLSVSERQDWWNEKFQVVSCRDVNDFDVMLGHEIALTILDSQQKGKPLVLILPVGPMGMYRWAVYFLQQWNISCDHIHGFNMDEWSDQEGNTLEASNPGAFQNAMQEAFYGPLGSLTVPESQRFFATQSQLPEYPDRIQNLRDKGADVAVIFGIGRVCHIAFWEPHFAEEFTQDDWKNQTYRLGAQLHPLTVEQNAITSFKSRTSLVSACANTIGPGIFLAADRIIGGADGVLGRGMQWQGLSLWMTLRYGPDNWVPSSYMPTLPGKLFYLEELSGPLVADCN